MQGKTHFFVGIAAALAICQPQTFPMLIAGTGAAAVGGVISDIDAGSSSAHHDADKVIAVIVAAVAAVIIADINFHIGIYERLLARTAQPQLITVLLVFLTLCAFGKSTRHRTFMHSLTALFLLSACVYLMLPELTIYFFIAFVSHLLLDLLNRRKVSILWPSKRGFCVGFCNSSGWVNSTIFLLGASAAILLIMTSTPVRTTGNLIGQWGNTVFDFFIQRIFTTYSVK